MEVRGTPDRQMTNNHLSKVREHIRIESGDGTPNAAGPKLGPQGGATELSDLLQELRSLPEVREELVQIANAKLKDGTYSSKESAEETAEAILRVLESE